MHDVAALPPLRLGQYDPGEARARARGRGRRRRRFDRDRSMVDDDAGVRRVRRRSPAAAGDRDGRTGGRDGREGVRVRTARDRRRDRRHALRRLAGVRDAGALMDTDDFTRALGPLAPRYRVTWYDVTDSTNTRALEALADGTARDGDVFVAGRQTAGRGTDGHVWVSDEPLGLWTSIVFTEPLRARPLSLLPAVALAIVLRRDHGVAAHLKWPNDVLVGAGEDTRKIAGILVESHRSPTAFGWVVGVGVNLNHYHFEPPLDAIATSLRMQARIAVSVGTFFASL